MWAGSLVLRKSRISLASGRSSVGRDNVGDQLRLALACCPAPSPLPIGLRGVPSEHARFPQARSCSHGSSPDGRHGRSTPTCRRRASAPNLPSGTGAPRGVFEKGSRKNLRRVCSAVVEVTATDADSTHIQLAHDPDWHRLQVQIQHIETRLLAMARPIGTVAIEGGGDVRRFVATSSEVSVAPYALIIGHGRKVPEPITTEIRSEAFTGGNQRSKSA